jgi:hypothetical protein
METKEYDVVDMKATTFSRVGQTSGKIELNNRYIDRLTPDEIEIQVIWCKTRRLDHVIPEIEVDVIVFDICKRRELLKPLLSAMVKQGKVTLSKDYQNRVIEMKKMIDENK